MTILLPRSAIRRDTGERVATLALGLTAYLAAPAAWAQGGVVAMLEEALELLPLERLRCYATSAMTRWTEMTPEGLTPLRDALDQRHIPLPVVQHGFSLQLADDPGAPTLGVRYTEVDPERADRAAVVEFTLPEDADPGVLFQLAMILSRVGELYSLTAGYALRWNPRWRREAFNHFHAWSRRFVGVDAGDPEELAWRAPTKLPSVNWLTLVGRGLAAANDLDLVSLVTRAWTHDVKTFATPAGLLLRAGEAPTPGDLNAMDLPLAYAEVTRALEGLLIDSPKDFWGAFLEERGRTTRWHRRLLAPEGWS